ncbi:MAG: cupredoxin domain-containing protein [Thermomicrobiales bacterium]
MRRLLFVVPLLWVLSLTVPLLGAAPIQAQGEEVRVTIIDFTFDPGTIDVQAGTTVTWTNNDSAPHTVTADGGSFDSGTLEPGDTFSFTFEEAGSFTYYCAIHPNMKAAVEVVAAESAPGEEATEDVEEAEATEEVAIDIANFAFDPGSIEIKAGATVTWTNNDTAPHTVTADNGAFDSGTLEPGDTFSWTFAEAGSVAYHCAIHPEMTASVEVGQAEEEEPPAPPPPPPPAEEEESEEAPEPTSIPDKAPVPPPAEEAQAEGQGEDVAVSIVNFAFDPGSIDVEVGTTVTWTNNDTAPHTVTADDGSFDSGTLEPGDTFSFTFGQAGSFAYFCAIHPNMTASVNVGETAEGAAPAASPAAGGEPTMVGASVDGSAAIWIMGKIEQRGGNFSLYGYVNHIEGLETTALFTDPDPVSWNETTARFTVFGEATMLNTFVLAERVFTTSAEGTLQFFFNERAGASFAAPESFFSGEQIAEAELDFRQTISIYAQQEGIADGAGAFTLTSTAPFTLDGASFQLGQSGQRHDMTSTGLGTLSEPAEPRSTLDIVARTETSGAGAPGEVDAVDALPAAAAADEPLTIDLDELNSSGISGTATLTPKGEETEVSLQLTGATGDHPAHIHLGTCDTLDPNPEFPLKAVAADGTSVTTVEVALTDLLAGEFAINVHDSVENIGLYIACGNISR